MSIVRKKPKVKPKPSENARPAAMSPDALRDTIEARGMTMTATAALLGVTKSTVHRWVHGYTPITERTAMLINSRFGVA